MLSADIPSRNRYTRESRETRVPPTRYGPSTVLTYSFCIERPNSSSHAEGALCKMLTDNQHSAPNSTKPRVRGGGSRARANEFKMIAWPKDTIPVFFVRPKAAK